MNLLAFDSSTDTLSIAVQRGDAVWQHTAAGGPQASATLIPAIQRLLAEAEIGFDALDVIVFGRGPGSFTGLRTACAVAQGLAFGARSGQGVPVLPVDTLLAVAEEARQQNGCTQVLAVLDARMNEVYSARCAWDDATQCWQADADFGLCAPESLTLSDADLATWTVAGNAHPPYGERLLPQARHVLALPTATALLRLAPALLVAGSAVPASDALPRYIRDKVANTTAEREALRAQASLAASTQPHLPAPAP